MYCHRFRLLVDRVALQFLFLLLVYLLYCLLLVGFLRLHFDGLFIVLPALVFLLLLTL